MPFISSVRGSYGPQGKLNSIDFDSSLVTGGTITTAGGYRIHTFLLPQSNTNFDISFSGKTTPLNVEYLIIAGGGGTESGPEGGGGAGGMISGSANIAVASYPIQVGQGAYKNPTLIYFQPGIVNDAPPTPPTTYTPVLARTGEPSIFNSIVSTGGGNAYFKGGSGGAQQPGLPGQGNAGGATTHVAPSGFGKGGGGGAGGAGEPPPPSRAGNGGPGANSSITGSAVTYAGGGGGGTYNGTAGTGGPGGGGPGRPSAQSPRAGTPGTDGLGGGAGGGNYFRPPPADARGGHGIVVIRYLQ